MANPRELGPLFPQEDSSFQNGTRVDPNYLSVSDSGRTAAFSVLKYTLSGIGAKKVQAATLTLTHADDATHPALLKLSLASHSNWTERDPSSSTSPSPTTSLDLVEVQLGARATLELDVTSALTQDGTYSLYLGALPSGEVRFSSREGGAPPALTLWTQ